MKVKFLPQDVEYEIKPTESVLHLAQDKGLHIQSVCKGLPSCAECRVRVVQGENNVIQPSPTELDLIGTAYFVDQRRLSCQLKCFGDITVDLTEQIEKENKTKKSRRISKKTSGGEEREERPSHARLGNIMDEEKIIKDDNSKK